MTPSAMKAALAVFQRAAATATQGGLRSPDFWRLENGLIRKIWGLVDLLDMWAQIGVDVLGRMREFNKRRGLAPIHLDQGLSL